MSMASRIHSLTGNDDVGHSLESRSRGNGSSSRRTMIVAALRGALAIDSASAGPGWRAWRAWLAGMPRTGRVGRTAGMARVRMRTARTGGHRWDRV
ncbi:hypothetical protein AKJ09_08364 [Labilithrix luteola]|uniref:Uncharacterized protein n=1 Tax=Labilithrix luteola TaxID=1391654 RepID=A0A0K1Q796_9BACT|nr:hypothetical protein AKJ09_08364 [Labilithrix luteola]